MNLTEPQAGSDLGGAHHPRRAATARAAIGSPARRSSSPGATTTWPTTSSTWCSPACPTRRRARAASRCSWPPSAWSARTARWARPTRFGPAASSTSSASTARRPASCSSRARRPSWSARPTAGLAHMFVMMNAARLQVGVQGVGVAERAYQQALAYALERRQGRSAWTGDRPLGAALRPSGRAPHADADEGEDRGGARHLPAPPPSPPTSRAQRRQSGGPRRRQAARGAADADRQGLVDRHGRRGRLDRRCRCTAAWASSRRPARRSHYRDARILPIYEGTNGIQAIDLMGRKLALGRRRGGRGAGRRHLPDRRGLKSTDDAWLHTIGAPAGRSRRRVVGTRLADRARAASPTARPARRRT